MAEKKWKELNAQSQRAGLFGTGLGCVFALGVLATSEYKFQQMHEKLRVEKNQMLLLSKPVTNTTSIYKINALDTITFYKIDTVAWIVSQKALKKLISSN